LNGRERRGPLVQRQIIFGRRGRTSRQGLLSRSKAGLQLDVTFSHGGDHSCNIVAVDKVSRESREILPMHGEGCADLLNGGLQGI